MCAKIAKAKSAEQALSSLMRECAKAEKSTGDAERLLARWGVEQTARAGIIETLIEQRFIDNRRFAEAYVRDKLNLRVWGERRIRQELHIKRVEANVIDDVFEMLISQDAMRERLRRALEKRCRTTKYKDVYDLKGKLLRYASSLGYDYELLRDVVEEVAAKA